MVTFGTEYKDHGRLSQRISDNRRQSETISFNRLQRIESPIIVFRQLLQILQTLRIACFAGFRRLFQDHYPACQTLMHSLFMILNYRKVPFCNLAYIDMGNNNGTPAFLEHPSHLTQ